MDRARALTRRTPIVAALLVVLLAVTPALELACDGGPGVDHEHGHLHASPALPVQPMTAPVIPLLSFGLPTQPAARLAISISSIFVPPRAG